MLDEKAFVPDAFLERIAGAREISGSAALEKLANRLYPNLPDEDAKLILLLDSLVSSAGWRVFWMVTQWIKRRKLYDVDYMQFYEKWLFNFIHSWGQCDAFCYRVLNPMVEAHPHLFENVMTWADSPKTYVRRAAPVSLLHSDQSFSVNCEVGQVLWIAEKLKHDGEAHVQNGVGWLLKYAYLTYPDEVLAYLAKNAGNLPRTIFRYALEKMPGEVKEELMRL